MKDVLFDQLEKVVMSTIGGSLSLKGGDRLDIAGAMPNLSHNQGTGVAHITSPGDCNLQVPPDVSIEAKTVGGHLSATHLDNPATFHTIGGHASMKHINRVHVHAVGGNASIGHANGTVDVHAIGGNAAVEHTNAPVTLKAVGGDAVVKHVMEDVVVGGIGGDLQARHVVGNVAVTGVGRDADIAHIAGNVSLHAHSRQDEPLAVKGFVDARHISGDFDVNGVLCDVELSFMGGSVQCLNVEGHIFLNTPFNVNSTYDLQAGEDIKVFVDPDDRATFVLPAGTDYDITGVYDTGKLKVTTDDTETRIRFGADENQPVVHVQAARQFFLIENEMDNLREPSKAHRKNTV
jgi:DUF4097 and DUF4098 domain-containing protein YvlB